MSKRPLILVSNDDGIHAPGIHTLAEEMSEFAEIYMVAPHKERSGYSHCLTISRPLRVVQLDSKPYCQQIYEVDGTPTDCVKIALDKLLPRKPDWVLSGINRGGNLGTDTLYSGTVAAAMEGILNGCKGMAISSHGRRIEKEHYRTAATVAQSLFLNQEIATLNHQFILNINSPAVSVEDLRGVKVASLGKRIYDDTYTEKQDPRGNPYYWIGADSHRSEDIPGSDCNYVEQGYATVTALRPSFIDESINIALQKNISHITQA